MLKFGIFAKVMLTLFVVLTPILILYAYSNRTSVDLLTDEIMKVKQNQIETFASQLDQTLLQLDTYQKMLYESTDVRNLAYPDLLGDILQKYKTVRTVSEEINRLAGYGDWKAVIAVAYPKTGDVIKSNSSLNALPASLPDEDTLWESFDDPAGAYFMEVLSYPRSPDAGEAADMRVVVKMDVAEIQGALTDFKAKGSGDPFLYKPGSAPIYNYTSDRELTDALLERAELTTDDGYFLSEAGDSSYQIHYEKVDSLGWYIVDYVPISQIMAPIERNNSMFYLISSLMLLMAVLLAFVLYRSVQIPFRKLMQSMNLIEKGFYSSRMKDRPKGEFRFLYDRFNSMASRIEELIEDVFKEQLRSKEATLKQLQSQINPHFLYNTLAYIKSMIELGEKEAAIAMTMNLSKYYRYTTKTGKKLATVREELEMVTHYLQINSSLMDGFEFEIEVGPEMMDMEVPRLIVQPLVENVILHGFKNRNDFGLIRIEGATEGDLARLTVEDSGVGLEPPALEAMNVRIRAAQNEEIESGLQNVHQRMKLLFGESSGLTIRKSPLGGVRAELVWKYAE